MESTKDETQLKCYTKNIEVYNLEECFRAILAKKPVTISAGTAYKIIIQLCNTPITYGDHRLKSILPYMLMHHMTIWPGWQKILKYKSNNLEFNKSLDVFKNYLTYKINYIIKNDFKKALNQYLNDDKANKADKPTSDSFTQTECQIKDFSPYTIVVNTPADCISRLLFSDGPDEKLVLKYHQQQGWSNLDVKIMFNWPHISVKFSTSEIEIRRSNKHQYVRYISLPASIRHTMKSDFIEEVDYIDEKRQRKAYTVNLLKEYCRKYVESYKRHVIETQNPTLSENMSDCEEFLAQFCMDIEEININQSFASNTSVLFNISGFLYSRSKKMRVENNEPTVCLFEYLTPKVELSLVRFYGVVTDETTGVSQFRTLNNPSMPFLRPTMEYNCTYCRVRFLSKKTLMDHLYQKHSPEPSMVCSKCAVQFDVVSLARNRWKHICKADTNETTQDDSQISQNNGI